MNPLITGSLAFDYLLRIDGAFGDRLPAPPQDGFSAAYLCPQLSRTWGGCAGNIAYALRMLDEQPAIMATAGSDFSPYAERLRALGIATDSIMQLPDFYTAQAHMVTDGKGSQLVFFHPGATAEAHRQRIADLPLPPPLAIVAPNGKAAILQHCRDLAAAGVPFIFDPGQAIGMFSAAELRECLELAPYAIFNAGEFGILQQATGLSPAAAAAMLEALFITDGENGSQALAGGETIRCGCVHLGATQDPTGCGDAYRAGLLYGLLRQWEWQPLLNFAAVVAAIKAMHTGGQGYAMSLASATAAYEENFNALPQ